MQKIVLVSLAALAVGLAGCSKPTQEKTSADLKAAGHQIGDAAKSVADTPELKAVGQDLKQGAQEAADKTKTAVKDAGPELKKAGADLKAGAHKAGEDVKSGADKANDATK
jgi:hypothetical protein